MFSFLLLIVLFFFWGEKRGWEVVFFSDFSVECIVLVLENCCLESDFLRRSLWSMTMHSKVTHIVGRLLLGKMKTLGAVKRPALSLQVCSFHLTSVSQSVDKMWVLISVASLSLALFCAFIYRNTFYRILLWSFFLSFFLTIFLSFLLPLFSFFPPFFSFCQTKSLTPYLFAR